MNILHDYAISIGASPKELEDDYFSAPEEEQLAFMSHIMQSGGEVAGSGKEANMHIVQLFAQKTNTPVEEVIAQLQQMTPEQQNTAIGQMLSVIEGDEQESVDNPQEEQLEVQQLGGHDKRSILGYSDNSPYRFDPSNLIKSNNITMDNTGIDLMGISDTGDIQFMPAYSGDYKFKGNNVLEMPVQQTGPDNYYSRMVSKPEYNEYLSLKANIKKGYGSLTRLKELEKIYEGSNFLKAKKLFDKEEKAILAQLEKESIVPKKVSSTIKKVSTPKFIPPDLNTLQKKINTSPVPFSESPALGDLSNYGTKMNVNNIDHYNRILEAKKIQAINKGIEATKAGRAYTSTPATNSSFSLKNLTDDALNRLANGSKSALSKLKALRSSGSTLTMQGLKSAIPEINLSNATKILPGLKKGLGIAGIALTANEVIEDMKNFNNPDYILTDDALDPLKSRAQFYADQGRPSLGDNSPGVTRNWFTDGSPLVEQLRVKGNSSGKDFTLTKSPNGIYLDESGNKWNRNPNGGFVIAKAPTSKGADISTTIPKQSITSPVTPEGLNNYFANQDTINKPTDGRIDFGNVQPIATRKPGEIQLETRFNKAPIAPKSIQYSPKIEGITPKKPSNKSTYKFNTSSIFGDLINNYKVSKAFEPIDLPYFEDVDYRMPDAPKYDTRPGLQAISESFSPYKNAINPNSTTGQAVLSSLASKELDAMQEYMNSIEQQQTQADYQGELNRADIYNKLISGRNVARSNYMDNLYKTNANRDAIIDNTLANVQQQNYNRNLEENAYQRMLAFNANLEDEASILDRILGRRKFSFNKDSAFKTNFG